MEQACSRRDRRRVIASRPSAQAAVRSRWGRTCDGGAGLCRKDPGLALCGLVSTVLTLTGPASMFPAGIVGILRFFTGTQSRFGVNVSAVDTDTPSCLASRSPSPPGLPACPGSLLEQVSQKS